MEEYTPAQRKKINQQFIRLLKERGAWTDFLCNNRKDKPCEIFGISTPRWAVEKILMRVRPKDYINSAFVWHETPQGSAFWYELHENWNLRLQTIKKNLLKQ